MKKERVYSVFDYWDGPIQGVADYAGNPHYYHRFFDKAADEYSDIYSLVALDQETTDCLAEQWIIWRRWETAFHAKRTTLETHPALPEDRNRYEELYAMSERKLQECSSTAFNAKGQFSSERPGYENLWVSWAPLDGI
jgi:hypothetical protein